jgi:hypothetical protein
MRVLQHVLLAQAPSRRITLPRRWNWARAHEADARDRGRERVEPEIQALFEPLYRRHLKSVDLIGGRATQDDGVVFFDLTGYDLEGYNKFIPYYLFPDCTYAASVSPSGFRTKVWVGAQAQPGEHFASATAAAGTRAWGRSALSRAPLN